MRLARWGVLLAAAGAVSAQTVTNWDTSGNGLLNGAFYFRQVVYSVGDSNGDLGAADTVYGEITFNGNGGYTISGAGANGGAVIIDASSGGAALNASTGTYAIGAGGYGYISSPGAPGDIVLGVVSAGSVFIGSTTDNAGGYNDMFIAAKIASPAFTNSNFNGSWTFSDFDPDFNDQLQASGMLNMIFTASPDGAGHFNPGVVKGYLNGSSSPYTQNPVSTPFLFSNGAAVVTFPANGQLVYGQKYFYFSPDGNFAFGGAPNGFDIIVGVKTTSAPALSGLYYQLGLDASLNANGGDIDTWFGSVNVLAGASPQTLIGHQRLNDFGGAANEQYGALLYDYTYTNTIALTGSTYTTASTAFIAGAGGQVLITTGLGGSLGISVALQAPVATGTGVFVNPQGVVNAASNAPFTARIAPGELLTLYGSNLAPSTKIASSPFPTTGLNGVQVTIGGYPAAIYYVSQTQISAIVPYAVVPGSLATIQVNNNGTLSNKATQLVSYTAPGMFTPTQNGLGYGDIEHLGIGNSVSPAGSLVADGNPAVEGETLAAYLTGLGTLTTAITDGAPGPATPDQTSNQIAVDFDLVPGTDDFSGLAPGYSGLYQLNFAIPATGVTLGPNYLDIEGFGPQGYPDSYMQYLLLPIQATASDTATSSLGPRKLLRSRKGSPAVRIPVKKVFSAKAGTEN